MVDIELKACPFCGSSEVNATTPPDQDENDCYKWICPDCVSVGPIAQSVKGATRKWNIRPPTPQDIDTANYKAKIKRLEAQLNVATKLLDERLDTIDRLSNGLDSINDLIENSNGVDGLHLNGNIAEWSELRTGGCFEEWLTDFDIALEASKGERQ